MKGMTWTSSSRIVMALLVTAFGGCAAGTTEGETARIEAGEPARAAGIDGYVVRLLDGTRRFEVELLGASARVLTVETAGDTIAVRSDAFELLADPASLLGRQDGAIVLEVTVDEAGLVEARGLELLNEVPALAAMLRTVTDDALWAGVESLGSACGGGDGEVGCQAQPLRLLLRAARVIFDIAAMGAACLDACSACAMDPMNETACDICNGPECTGIPGL